MPSSYRRLWPLIRSQRYRIAAIIGLSFALSATAGLQPWPLKLLADYALGDAPWPSPLQATFGTPSAAAIVVLAAATSIALFAFRTALDSVVRWVMVGTGQGMVYDLTDEVFDNLIRLDRSYHARHSIGDSLTRIGTDTYSVYYITQGIIFSPIQALFTIGIIGTLAWTLDPLLTLLTTAMAPVLAFSAIYFGGKIKAQSRNQVDAGAEVAGFVHQTLSAIPIVQAFGTVDRNRDTYTGLAQDVVAQSQRASLYKNLLRLASGLTLATGAGVVIYVGGLRTLSGAITIGSLLVFVEYLRNLQGAFRQLIDTFTFLKAAEAGIDRVLEALDSPCRVAENPEARALEFSEESDTTVEIDRVSFSYTPDTPILTDVTLAATAGETIAVVGPTGAGKSTLVSLLPRLFDPDSGSIRLFGQDVRDLRIQSVREQVGLVLQDPHILPVSAKQNIAYGRPGASDEEIVLAAKAANCDAFIRDLPDGYDTVIGEKGATLSGGQRQRIAIARALLRAAPILILDEPTSALDVETESLLIEALDRLMEGKTTFIIAHRLSTVQNADRIAVLDEGRLVELGHHDTLMQQGGLYSRMYRLQHDTEESTGT